MYCGICYRSGPSLSGTVTLALYCIVDRGHPWDRRERSFPWEFHSFKAKVVSRSFGDFIWSRDMDMGRKIGEKN